LIERERERRRRRRRRGCEKPRGDGVYIDRDDTDREEAGMERESEGGQGRRSSEPSNSKRPPLLSSSRVTVSLSHVYMVMVMAAAEHN
jgi:hypothetical protein